MALAALGMLLGLSVAVNLSVIAPARLSCYAIEKLERLEKGYNPRALGVALPGVVAAFVVQLWLDR